jgi:hypothetical protein
MPGQNARGGAANGRQGATPPLSGLAARAGRGEATTIDALFGPLPTTESRGRAWTYVEKKLVPVNLRLGVSDGTFTEILSGELNQGTEVVTNMVTGLEPRAGTTPANNANNPLMGPQRGGPPGGRGGGGGGGRGQ